MIVRDLANSVVIFNPHRQKKIPSFGIVAYHHTTRRFLVVCRRFSPNYITVLRGAFKRSNLPKLIYGMTLDEQNSLMSIFNGKNNIEKLIEEVCPFSDREYACMRFKIEQDLMLPALESAFQKKYFSTKEWLFPKGRIERNESFLDAAYREFREETGVSTPLPIPINTRPIVVYHKGDNDFFYETRYWVISTDEELVFPENYKNYEISDCRYFSLADLNIVLSETQKLVLQEACATLL